MGTRVQWGWAAAALLLALAVGCAPPPAKTGSIAGKVTVEDGTFDAVFVAIPGDVRLPNADGTFAFDGLLEGTYQVSATKEGYVTATAQATVTQGKVADVTLALQKKAPDDRAPLLTSLSVSPDQIPRGGQGKVLAVAVDPDGDPLTYAFHAGDGWTVTANTNEPNTAVLRAPDADQASTEVTVEVTDGRGGKVTGSVLVGTLPNHSPLITSVVASPSELQPGASGTLAVQAADPDGDQLTYAWKAPAGWTVEGQGAQVTVIAPNSYDKTAVVNVDVTDLSGATVSGAVAVSTAHNQAPIFSSLTALPTPVAPGGQITLAASASDPEGGQITYTWTAPEGWTLSGTGAQVTLTAPAQHGVQALVQVAAADPAGKTTQSQVLVRTTMNGAPLLTALTATPPQVAPGRTLQLQAVASDPDGETLSYTWSAPTGWTLQANGASATVTAPGDYGQTGRVQLVVDDGQGGRVTGEVAVSTTSNNGPLVQSITAVPNVVRPGGSVQLAVSASDPDGDRLTYAWTVPAGWTLSGTGAQVTLTAPSTYGQVATVRVAISDGSTQTEASVVVGTQADRAPVISSLVGAPNPAARAGVVQVNASASDPDGDALSYTWTAPDGWTLAGTGAQVALTAPDQRGTSGILRLDVTSGSGLTASSQLLVSTFDNRPPLLTGLTATPSQVAPGATIALKATASDPDGDTLAYDWSVPAGWTLTGTGAQVTVTAPQNAFGQTGTVFLAVSDPLGVAASGRVQVSTRANQAPTIGTVTAAPNPAHAGERVEVTASATDPENQQLTYTWRVPSGWTLVSGGATAVLTASAQRGITGSLEVQVDDGFGGSATKSVELSTQENGDPQVTLPSSGLSGLAPGQSVTVQATATDPENDTLSYAWAAPSGWTLSGSGAQVTLTAPARFTQTGQLSVTVTDGYGGSAQATADVSTRDNLPPTIGGIAASPNPVLSGHAVTVTASASDPDGQSLTYGWSVPAGWTLSGSGAQVTVVAPDERGISATLGLTVTDSAGATATGSVDLATAQNHPPTVAVSTGATLPAAPGTVLALHAAASDPDSDPLTYAWTAPSGWTLSGSGPDVQVAAPALFGQSGQISVQVSDPYGATQTAQLDVSTRTNSRPVIGSLGATPNPAAAGGTLQVSAQATDADGQELTYTWSVPSGWTLEGTGNQVTLTAPNERGLSATLGLSVSDGLEATTRTLTVGTVSNNAPTVTLQAPNALGLAPLQQLAVQASASDSDNDQLTFSWNVPNGWTLSGSGAQVTITAPNAYSRTGAVQLQVADPYGGQATATLSVGTRADRAPVIAGLDVGSMPVLTSTLVGVHASASDPDGNPLTYTWSAPPGWEVVGDGADVSLQAPATRGSEGLLHLEVSDGFGATATADAQVSTVPNAQPQAHITTTARTDLAPGAAFDLDATASDADGDGLTYRWTVPDGWTIDGASDQLHVTVHLPDQYGASGTVHFAANDGFGGSGLATIDLATRAGHAPTVDDLAATPNPAPAGGQLDVVATASDLDGDTLHYAWTVPDGWTLSGTGAHVTITAPNEHGAQADLTVTVDDGYQNTASRTITLETAPNNAPTVSLGGDPSTDLAPGAQIGLTATASDADGDQLSYAWTAPTGWTIGGAGASVTLAAPNGYGSSGQVRVTVTDPWGASAFATAFVSTRGGHAPVIGSLVADNTSVAAGGTIHLTASATDPDGDQLSYAWSASSGWAVTGSGSSAAVLAASARGVGGVITVEVSDGYGNVASSTIDLQTNPNAAPTVTLTGDPASDLAPGAQLAFDAVGLDDDNDQLTYTWTASSGWTVSGSGAHAQVTAPNAYGASGQVRVTVSDGFGGSAQAVLQATTRAGHAPSISSLVADSDTAAAGGTIHLTTSASDPDGDTLHYAWSISSGWTVVGGSDGTATVTAIGTRGADGLVTVTVDDGYGNQVSLSRALHTSPNAAPTVTLTNDAAGDVAPGAQVAFDAVGLDDDNDQLTYEWNVPTGWTLNANGAHAVVTVADAYGISGEVHVTVTDGFGGSAQATNTLATRAGHPPVVSDLVADNDTVAASGTIHLTATASDPDGDTLHYTWAAPTGWTINGTGASATLTATTSRGADAIVTVTVNDGYGNQASRSITVHTQANQAPTIASVTASPATVEKGGTISVQATASDADGDSLSYAWTSPDGWTLTGTGAQVSVVAPLSYGQQATLQLTVTDGFGGSVTSEVALATYENRAPTFSSTAPTASVRAGRATLTYQAQASDPDHDDLHFQLVGAPDGAAVDGDGTVTWSPTHAQTGDASFVVRVSDGQLTADQTIAFTVSAFDLDASSARPAANVTATRVGDVTGDGHLDLVAVTSDGNVLVFAGNGQGALAAATTAQVASAQFVGLQLADVNGDGALDVVALDEGDHTAALIANDGTGGFAASPTRLTTGLDHVRGLAVEDFDLDGRFDVLVAGSSGANDGVKLLTRDSQGAWAAGGLQAAACATTIATADLDADGAPDALVAGNCASGVLKVLMNDGTAGFTASDFDTGASGAGARSLQAADLDGDGHLDLVVATPGDNSVRSYFGNGTGAFAATPSNSNRTVALQPGADGLVLADLDDDGHLDAVTSNAGTSSGGDEGAFNVLFGDGHGALSAAQPLGASALTGGVCVGAGDLNGDGRVDVTSVSADHAAAFH